MLIPALLALPADNPTVPALIPQPVALVQNAGSFTIDETTVITADSASRPAAALLSGWLQAATGHAAKIGGRGKIRLSVDPKLTGLGTEGYHLAVAPSGISLSAPKYAGIVNGLQTLRQLWPTGQHAALTVPAVTIDDQPRFGWRGMMLDVARYFLDKTYVLHFLDVMAAHKLNVLHFHLIDDQGWRVEIKKYPKLTEIGGFRGEGVAREGGFFTQADIKEIVAYAAQRNITVVPEIELPAHTLSAVCAYPWLSCTGEQHKMPTVHFISEELYCAGKESTWTFLKDVLDELCGLFPSTYIHIGGDEARYTRWKACPACQKKRTELGLADEKALQGWMTREVEKIVAQKGKHILGWDEILRCGVSSSAGIMPWADPKAATDAARSGNPVMVALTDHCYFDMQESRLRGELPGAGWRNPVTLQAAYDWDPVPVGLTPEQQRAVQGAQGCLWTDMFLHRPDLKKLGPGRYCDYFLLPRAAALAEVVWTPQAQRRFPDFQERLRTQLVRYTDYGWDFRLPLPEVTINGNQVTAQSPIAGGTVRYTLDGTDPKPSSPALTGPLTLTPTDDFKAITLSPDGKRTSLIFENPTPGRKVGEWHSGKIGDRKPLPVDFDLTPLVTGNGTYLVTFLYSHGRERLDIDKVELHRSGAAQPVAVDSHHGVTGGFARDNTYTLKLTGHQPGTTYTLRAYLYGDEGSDSNGTVYVKKVQ